MLVKAAERRIEERQAGYGGTGMLNFEYICGATDVPHMRLCSILTFDPGDMLGQHAHTNETEIYFMLEGELIVDDNGEKKKFLPGDAVITGGGDYHSVENASDAPASFLAVIVTE